MVAAEKQSIFQASRNINCKAYDERGEENPSSQHGHTEECGLEVWKIVLFENDVDVCDGHQTGRCEEIDAFNRV